jgi:hypothetical protein
MAASKIGPLKTFLRVQSDEVFGMLYRHLKISYSFSRTIFFHRFLTLLNPLLVNQNMHTFRLDFTKYKSISSFM